MLYAICYMLYAICYMLYAICYKLYAICYMLYTICYLLYAICHMLYAICYMIDVICYMLYATGCGAGTYLFELRATWRPLVLGRWGHAQYGARAMKFFVHSVQLRPCSGRERSARSQSLCTFLVAGLSLQPSVRLGGSLMSRPLVVFLVVHQSFSG